MRTFEADDKELWCHAEASAEAVNTLRGNRWFIPENALPTWKAGAIPNSPGSLTEAIGAKLRRRLSLGDAQGQKYFHCTKTRNFQFC